MFDIRLAAPEDFAAVETLLSLCLLPGDGVRAADTTLFVAETERGIIGCAALCDFADGNGLLRSVAVMPGYRKQNIARHLFQHILAFADQGGIGNLYLLTATAAEYFQPLGFRLVSRHDAPSTLLASPHVKRLAGQATNLLHRKVVQVTSANGSDDVAAVANQAKQHFDNGFHCAESVLLAVADALEIRSPLIPAIATGFCNGVSQTWGTCGALNGGIMAVNITHGRSAPREPVANNYRVVRTLIQEFSKACGGVDCSRLMGCDLDTTDGRRVYQDNRVRQQCREYVGIAAGLSFELARSAPGIAREDQAAA